MATGEPLPAAPFVEGPKLRRELRLIDALSIIVGIIVGSGIFTTPGVVLAQAGSVFEGLLAWLLAGTISLSATFLYAELATSIPVASGDAEFLKVAFGPSWSFLFIWTSFLVLFPGAINIQATALSQYFLAATSYADISTQDMDGDQRVKYIALGSMVALTIINCAGVRFGSFLQNVLGLFKAFLVLVILAAAAIFLTRDTSLLRANFSKPFMGSSLIGFGPSMVAALWAFSGFQRIVFLTEEMKNPSRDIPRASFSAIFVVTSTYLAVNLSYLSVLPSSDVKKSLIVAMDTTKAVFGQQAGRFTAMLVALSLLGSLNAVILCGGRYLYSAARDGHFYGGWLGEVNEHSGAPAVALMAQGVWSVFISLLSANVVKLLHYVAIANFLFFALMASAHWKLRYQFPGFTRPFRVPMHPCLNILVLLASIFMIGSSIWADPVPTIGALIFAFSSFPVYHIFVKRKNVEPLLDDENGPLLR